MGLSKISVVLVCALWFFMVHSCHAQDPLSNLIQAEAPMIQDDKTPDKYAKTPDKDDKTSNKDDKTPDKDNKSEDTDDKTSEKDDNTKDKDDRTPDKDDKDKDDKTKDNDDKTPDKDNKDKDDKDKKDKDDKTTDKDDKPKDMDDKTPDKDKTQQPKDTNKSNDKNLDNKTAKSKDSEPKGSAHDAPQPQGTPQPPEPKGGPQAISPTSSGNSPQDWVEAHNAHRRLENVVLMTWNVSLAQYAQTYVQTIAPTCKPKHSGGPWGECLFMGDGAATAKEIVDYWASEQKYWDPKTKKCQDGEDCGHYLQVVNPNSPAVGCGKAKCANDPFYWFVICDYIW